jgi:inositol 3-alpha-galactosyltransferase
VVLYTPNLPSLAVEALNFESKHSSIIPKKVKPLKPGGYQETYLIAARFADTWTKLQVFSEPMHKYNQVCYLDADMLIFNENMDCVFEAVQLPRETGLEQHRRAAATSTTMPGHQQTIYQAIVPTRH